MNIVEFGGSATPSPEFPATRDAAFALDQPVSFIHGMVTEPTVAALPAVLPATSPISADPKVET